MRFFLKKIIASLFLVVSLLLTGGVYATWRYAGPMIPVDEHLSIGMQEFVYKPEGILYITEAQVVSKNNAIANVSASYSLPTNLNSLVSVTQNNGQVTYKITVYNDTDVTYWYMGAKTEGEYPGNSYLGANGGITLLLKDKLSDSSGTFDTNDWVPPKTTRDFYVIYTYGNATVGQSIATLIKFQFGIKMDSVQDEFLKILNDKVSTNGYYYLADAFDDKYAEDKSMVIGNIGEDEAIFHNLFGRDLTVDVNGVETPVTVMVQRKDVDKRGNTGDAYSNGPSGCEYTLYITVDPLDSPTGKAIVYVVSYSCKSDGTWYQIGQLYEGTANKADYDMSNGTYEGAIDVGSWIATQKEYKISDQIYYKVGYTQHGTNYDMLKTVEEIMSTDDRELFNKINNSQILKKVYDVLRANANSEAPEVVNLRAAFDGMTPYINIFNNGQEVKLKDNLTAPRAEFLPYIIKLCEAYDYYLQVHG